MCLWFNAFVATSTRQVELRQKEGHPSVRVFDRAVEDAQGRKTVGGPWLGKEDPGRRCDVLREGCQRIWRYI